MSTGLIDQLEAAVDALAAEDVGVPGREEILRLEQLRSRLDAQCSRRLDALDAERTPDQTLVVQEYESRALHLSEILDGVVMGEFRLDREAGAYLRRAIDLEYHRLHQADDPRTPAQQRADALTSIMRQHL